MLDKTRLWFARKAPIISNVRCLMLKDKTAVIFSPSALLQRSLPKSSTSKFRHPHPLLHSLFLIFENFKMSTHVMDLDRSWISFLRNREKARQSSKRVNCIRCGDEMLLDDFSAHFRNKHPDVLRVITSEKDLNSFIQTQYLESGRYEDRKSYSSN